MRPVAKTSQMSLDFGRVRGTLGAVCQTGPVQDVKMAWKIPMEVPLEMLQKGIPVLMKTSW